MYYIADIDKSFDLTCIDLESGVTGNDFRVLHVHDLSKTQRAKGITLAGIVSIGNVVAFAGNSTNKGKRWQLKLDTNRY